MTEAGPAAKRPPHMLLETVLRVVIALLLGPLLLGSCDRQEAGGGQVSGAAAGNAATPPPLSDPPLSDEVPPGPAAPAAAEVSPVKVDRSHRGTAAPAFVFADAAGRDATLAAFRGRPLLVNLWATWCGPCVAEMPQLDALASAGAGTGMAVLAVSQDSQGADKATPFFRQRGYRHLTLYLDPENQLSFHYGTGLLPTSVLYGRDGREVARIAGALDWTGAEAKALIAEAAAASG